MHFQLSWRNIWRNPKRTLIILTAVVIGAWTMLAFSALSRGFMASTLSTALNNLTGHIQIQAPQFRDDPSVENRVENPGSIAETLQNILPREARWTFRIQVGGAVSNARNTKGITIVGIDPEKEPGISFYGEQLSAGKLLKQGDKRGIIIGHALAKEFETKPGRKLVLMTQGADGETSSAAYKIRGIFRAELEATEKQFLFITLPAAQKLIGVGEAITNVCIKLPDTDTLDMTATDNIITSISAALPKNVAVLAWPDLLPLLKGYLDIFDSFMLLWYVVGFVAMAFGLVNTMIMAVLERTREFGLLKALGMKPVRIITNVLLECLILLVLGLFAGNLLGVATVTALSKGIDLSFLAQGSEFFGMGTLVIPFLEAKDILSVNTIILSLGLLVCLYPAVKAGRITPVDAMAGH